jgi:hypothetical protein
MEPIDLQHLQITDELVDALSEERSALGTSAEAQAGKIFSDHLPAAAYAICKVAVHSDNPQLRLRAAQYIVDRQLGKAVQSVRAIADNDPLMKFLSGVEDAANAGVDTGTLRD